MNKRRGTFLVIEGTDGSGKGTQLQLLKNRLEQEGYDVAAFDFPQYGEPSSYFVREYLNGRYGSADEVGPYTGSLFYALDRFQAASLIQEALEQGKVVLANRFTGSNMAHQGTKFNHAEERRGYFIWLDNLEFQMLGIPRPDRSIVLRVPAETAQKLVDKKGARSYTSKKRDIHEADLDHLKRAVAVYDDLCQLFPKDFMRVDCVRSGKLLDITTVSDLLWKTIEPLLPVKPVSGKKTRASSVAPPNPYIKSSGNGYVVTPTGEAYLKEILTTSEGSIYGLTDQLKPLVAAAVLAEHSGDIRTALLEELGNGVQRDEQLLQRAAAIFGNDLTRQFVGQHIIIEGASQLLSQRLQDDSRISCLVQPYNLIEYDKQDEHGNYQYYVPKQLDPQTKRRYKETMDQIFGHYTDMLNQLTTYIRSAESDSMSTDKPPRRKAAKAQAQNVLCAALPVASTASVAAYADVRVLEDLVRSLRDDELAEANQTGKGLTHQIQRVLPEFLEGTSESRHDSMLSPQPADVRHDIRTYAEKYLPQNHSAETNAAQLVSFWPRNELDLVADMLYEHSNVPFESVQDEVRKWPFERKEEVFRAYLSKYTAQSRPTKSALEKAQYSWDVICDYRTFRDLQRQQIVRDIAWQHVTPRYGYDVPNIVEEAGLSEQFIECFDLSLKLHSYLQEAGYELEAQYATLMGHRMHLKLTCTGQETICLYDFLSHSHSNTHNLAQLLLEKLAEVHPLLAESMQVTSKTKELPHTPLFYENKTPSQS